MITIYINVLLSKYIQCLLFSNTSIELLQRVLGNLTAINLLFLPKAEKKNIMVAQAGYQKVRGRKILKFCIK